MNILLALLCCNTCGLFDGKFNNNLSPKIIIVGAGAAGIAAASKLYENGFNDIKILEAENRIGGRIHSVKFGDYMVDMGAQWVHGEKNNVAFELAWPLGLLERFNENYNVKVKYFGSSGLELSSDITLDIQNLEGSIVRDIINNKSLQYQSFGEYAELKYRTYFEAHPELQDLHVPLLYTFQLSEMVTDGGEDSWYDISTNGVQNYPECKGDSNINWKNQTYSTILDILMKKYPNPQEELPVLNNTFKNSKVIKINYNKAYDTIKVLTANGKEYLADHVIFTSSLGVLKSNYQRLFNPPLPEKKITAIKNIGFGNAAKIYLYYDDPWWINNEDEYTFRNIYWTDADREEIENDLDKNWMLGVYGAIPVEHKPNLLCLWMSSTCTIEMELIPDEIFQNQITELLKRFYGHVYNVTEPKKIIRSAWNVNDNFRGTYSYPAVAAELTDVDYSDLAEPIMRNNKPILQFAGEATSKHFSTVHGAIESGWREAERLINLYSQQNDLSQLLKRLSKESGLSIN